MQTFNSQYVTNILQTRFSAIFIENHCRETSSIRFFMDVYVFVQLYDRWTHGYSLMYLPRICVTETLHIQEK